MTLFLIVLFVLKQKVPIRQLADKKIYIEPCLTPGRLRTGHSLTPTYFLATAPPAGGFYETIRFFLG